MEMLEGQVSIFDFNMLHGEEKHIKVPYAQMVVILEALHNFKASIENNMPDNVVGELRFKDKLEDVNYLIEVIEQGTEYNFHRRLDKCKLKNVKKDDAGMDALSASVVLKEEKAKKEGEK
ncbi:hypothetical protein [Clostridium sp. B9]|uniref:hypothetical protein n=1 Tax=Clostridium sp. B9 TaxID=3423224 RepID=UPI003D2F1E6E